MKNKIKKLLMTLGACFALSTVLVGCSTTGGNFSPESVIENVLADTDTVDAYYGESVMKSNDGTPDLFMKEWITTDGRVRVESFMEGNEELGVTINNGTEIISYDQLTNTAYTFKMDEQFETPSPKEQAEMMLNAIKDTHTITLVGEEKLLDRDVYHIKAESKEKNSLYGNQEIWVDMENWFVLKSKSTSGDMEIDYEYTKIEFDPTFDDSLFTIDLPDDVEIQNLDELIEESEVKSIEEAKNLFGRPFLYVEEKDELTIEKIMYMSFDR